MKGVGLLRKLRSNVPRDSFLTIYKSFIRPLVDYGDVIYHSPFGTSSLNKLESTQYQAGLAISGAWKGTSAAKLYEDLGRETLAERRCYRWLLLFFENYLKSDTCILARFGSS